MLLLKTFSNFHINYFTDRPAFMVELRKNATALTALQSRVIEAHENQQNLVATAIQRLKWAAGANPALVEVMAAFDTAVANSAKRLTRQAELSTAVAMTCNSVFHFEALRTHTQESKTNDTNFLTLFKFWEESCVLYESLNPGLTSFEENLAEILPDDQGSDDAWLTKTEAMVSESIIQDQKDLQENQELLKSSRQDLQDEVGLLQEHVAEHHKLMNEVRSLLRSMAKHENISGLQDYLLNYRSWTEKLSATVKELESEDLDCARAAPLKAELEDLTEKTPEIYSKLLSFAQQNSGGNDQKSLESFSKKQKSIKQDGVLLSPRKMVVAVRDPTTGKGESNKIFI